MTTEKIYSKLNEIFRDVFENETIIVSETTTASDIDEWDSFMQLNLIVAIESEFRFRFSVKDIASFKNVGDIAEIISAKVKSV